MKPRISALLFICLLSAYIIAQTPYDSFAPEATRPMIEREALYPEGTMQTEEQSTDTVLCVAVVDLQRQTLLLISIHDNTIIGTAPLSDDILKWLSVDPLADKNIATSPYMYCNGNPIMLIDPNGEDVWEINENGVVINQIKDNTQDAFRMNGKQISFKYGSVTGDYQTNHQTTFTFNDENVAADAFKFMADNSSVEYGLIISKSGNSAIVTQHNEGSVATTPMVLYLSKNGEVITTLIHNHPSNNGEPSGFHGENKGDRNSLIQKESILNYSIDAFTYTSKSSMLQRYSSNIKNVGTINWGIVFPNVGELSHQPSTINKYILLPYKKCR